MVNNMNYNKGNKLLTERFHLIWAGEGMSWTCRITLKMKDAVDGDILREAVESTRQRYPYYQVRLGIRKDAAGMEYYVYEDNNEPWVVSEGENPVQLIGPESNHHLLAFSYWDDCVAIDFFHGMTDGTGGYNILRTLLYEYSRRRYDATLSPETDAGRIRLVGDTISPEEWEDPATKVKPENIHPMPLPELPKCINLLTQSKSKLTETVEAINIIVEEKDMMKYVSSSDTSPATLVSLLLNRAIGRLHPDSSEGVPMMVLAINERPALGCPKTSQSLASSIMLPLSDETRGLDIDMQQTIYRGMVILQSTKDNVIERFWKSKNVQDMFERIPTLEARHQAMVQAYSVIPSATSACVSYVGRANMGASEKYVSEMYTEVFTPYALAIEMGAIGGTFCFTFMQKFEDDSYLNAFLDEFRQIGITCRIANRHKMIVAPIADYRIALK